jgi:hypothetical protein
MTAQWVLRWPITFPVRLKNCEHAVLPNVLPSWAKAIAGFRFRGKKGQKSGCAFAGTTERDCLTYESLRQNINRGSAGLLPRLLRVFRKTGRATFGSSPRAYFCELRYGHGGSRS